MSRPYVLWIPLLALASAPFALACDALRGGDKADAAAVVVTAPPPVATTAAPVADPNAAPPTTGAVAPLGAATAPVPTGTATVHPTALPDGGKPKDAGATPTAAPTPTFQIPTAIPGFDAGGFKPPPGFPTALPTFPPPAKP